jgi:hypothetical protein
MSGCFPIQNMHFGVFEDYGLVGCNVICFAGCFFLDLFFGSKDGGNMLL